MKELKDPKELREWIHIIAVFIAAVAGVLLTYTVGKAANNNNATQVRLNDANTQRELQLTGMSIKHEQEIKSIEIFLDLIKSDRPREKEMAVRLLHILDEDMALKLAISIATNKSEDRDIALTAFRIGRQIQPAAFLEALLGVMNITLSDNNYARVKGYLADPYSGYQQLAEALYLVCDRSSLQGRAVPIDNINHDVMVSHRASSPILEVTRLNPALVANAVLARWREKNSSARVNSFSDILY